MNSRHTECFQVLAVGCGPFNLSLAALASGIDDLSFVALDSSPEFRWHPGLMLDDATLQVSFLADLVSLVEPTHRLSFLAYLKARDRMYPFYVRERFHITRREYEDYLRWVITELSSVRFSHTVERVEWCDERRRFLVRVRTGDGAHRSFEANHLALGIGTEPFVPELLRSLPATRTSHSSDYLGRVEDMTRASHVTVIGSGQSGAEIVLDLIRRGRPGKPGISWLTRTVSFAPLDYTKLVLEMTTPEYVDYFHGLPEARRDALVTEQWRHYKGISTATLEEVHEELYRRLAHFGSTHVELRSGTSVESARVGKTGLKLLCRHRDTGESFEHDTDFVVTATGYRHRAASFLEPIDARLLRDGAGRWAIRRDHSIETDSMVTGKIFVANGDLHSHGVAAPDLGIGAYRAATMLNSICGRVVFELPKQTAFSDFAIPCTSDGTERPRARPSRDRSVSFVSSGLVSP